MHLPGVCLYAWTDRIQLGHTVLLASVGRVLRNERRSQMVLGLVTGQLVLGASQRTKQTTRAQESCTFLKAASTFFLFRDGSFDIVSTLLSVSISVINVCVFFTSLLALV